jgi:hypothetical protein
MIKKKQYIIFGILAKNPVITKIEEKNAMIFFPPLF